VIPSKPICQSVPQDSPGAHHDLGSPPNDRAAYFFAAKKALEVPENSNPAGLCFSVQNCELARVKNEPLTSAGHPSQIVRVSIT
jgi:hypothetical protein